jgi:S1-C subfamily serine protease
MQIKPLRFLLIPATFLMSFLPPAFAQPPGAWEHPHPPVVERADGPALGVLVDELPFEKLDEFGLSYGVGIERVIPDTPAAQAGLQAGDILTEVDGHPVFSVPRLRWLVAQAEAGTAVTVTYRRDDTTATAEITPRKLHAGMPPSPHRPAHPGTPGYLGVRLQPLTPGLREAFDVPEDTGALVAEVSPDSPAARAGLRAGDVIVKMDRRTVRAIDDVLRVLDYLGPGEPVKIDIIRDKDRQTISAELGENTEQRGYTRHPSWHHPDPESLPFFADPDWWEDMQQYMERWRDHREQSRDEVPGRIL